MPNHTANYHLADSRDSIRTIDEAIAAMADIRRLTCQREVVVARYEKRIAALTAEARTASTPVDGQLEHECKRLERWILANLAQFKPPNKRKIRTPDGEFGTQTTTRLVVDDPNAVLDWMLDNDRGDCIQIIRKLKKPETLRLINSGETIPGARRDSGEIALCRVNKTLVNEAVNNAN